MSPDSSVPNSLAKAWRKRIPAAPRSLGFGDDKHVLQLVGSELSGEVVGHPRAEQNTKDCGVDFVRERDHGVLRLIAAFVFGLIGTGELVW